MQLKVSSHSLRPYRSQPIQFRSGNRTKVPTLRAAIESGRFHKADGKKKLGDGAFQTQAIQFFHEFAEALESREEDGPYHVLKRKRGGSHVSGIRPRETILWTIYEELADFADQIRHGLIKEALRQLGESHPQAQHLKPIVELVLAHYDDKPKRKITGLRQAITDGRFHAVKTGRPKPTTALNAEIVSYLRDLIAKTNPDNIIIFRGNRGSQWARNKVKSQFRDLFSALVTLPEIDHAEIRKKLAKLAREGDPSSLEVALVFDLILEHYNA